MSKDDTTMMDQTGQCLCGAVQYRAHGKMAFSNLCHCRACSWAMSTTPVHIIGVRVPELEYLKGKEHVVVTKGWGKMVIGRCSECMTALYQKPGAAAPFTALFPPAFHIGGSDSVHQKLPDKYLPQNHVNYENRARDMDDSLPKWKTYPGNNQMNNDGTLM